MQVRSHPAHLALVVMFGIGTGLGAAQIRPAAKGKALPGGALLQRYGDRHRDEALWPIHLSLEV